MADAGNAIRFTLKESTATTVVLTGTKSDGSTYGSANITLTSGAETTTITATVNVGEFSKDFTIGGLTPATTYAVTYSGDIARSGNVTSVTTLADEPKTATESQWQDLVARVKAKADASSVPTVNDTLTSTSTSDALSANQGKVLKDLIDSTAIRGVGAPTTSTVGQVGTLYEDTTNGDLYICTDATNPYVWGEVGAGGGASALTITITPDQQTGYAFTWTGATIAEIQTAFDNGTEVLIGTPGFILKVIARRSTTSAEELTVALDSYNTMALYLYSDGRGESDLFTLVSSETLTTALANKQDTLTAGDGISITNGVISCTFANGNGVSY